MVENAQKVHDRLDSLNRWSPPSPGFRRRSIPNLYTAPDNEGATQTGSQPRSPSFWRRKSAP